MAPSANIGRVLWPEKAKTHEINEMVTKNPSSSFDIFTAYPPWLIDSEFSLNVMF